MIYCEIRWWVLHELVIGTMGLIHHYPFEVLVTLADILR